MLSAIKPTILITYPDSQYFTYGYDVLGRMTSLADGSATTLLTQTYKPWGGPHGRTVPGSGHDLLIGHDQAQRIDSYYIQNGSSPFDVSWLFARNPASQITSETRSNDSYAWTGHTNVDRAYAANGLNQYTAAGPAVFAYDANGNLTADGTQSYIYDSENRLLSRSGGGTTAALRYDPLGRLYEVVGTTNGVPTSATRFQYDGDALIAEYDTAGAMQQRYVHGSAAGVDDPLINYGGSSVNLGNARFLYADPRGSIVLRSDGAGTGAYANTYDEYGIPGAGNIGRFQYTGQIWIPELGMYYYKARAYSPTLGRFMQPDPIGYGDGMNMYRYVRNDPINAIDPSGTRLWTPRDDDVIRHIAELMARLLRGVLDEIVVTAHQNGTVKDDTNGDSIRLFYNKGENEWILYLLQDLRVQDAHAKKVENPCTGATPNSPTVRAAGPIAGVAHGHQDATPPNARGETIAPYPGASDGNVVALRNIPNYVSSSTDLWVIRPGSSGELGKLIICSELVNFQRVPKLH